jgi:hypothetical protein
MRTCRICNKTKPLNDENFVHFKGVFYNTCRECSRRKQREKYAKLKKLEKTCRWQQDPDCPKLKIIHKAWLANAIRIRQEESEITAAVLNLNTTTVLCIERKLGKIL